MSHLMNVHPKFFEQVMEERAALKLEVERLSAALGEAKELADTRHDQRHFEARKADGLAFELDTIRAERDALREALRLIDHDRALPHDQDVKLMRGIAREALTPHEPQPPAPQKPWTTAPLPADFYEAHASDAAPAPQPAAEGPIPLPVRVDQDEARPYWFILRDRMNYVVMESHRKGDLEQIAAALNAQPAGEGAPRDTTGWNAMVDRCFAKLETSSHQIEGICERYFDRMDDRINCGSAIQEALRLVQPAAGGVGEVLTDAQIEEIAIEHAGEYHSLAMMLIREALLRVRLRGERDGD